MTAQPDPPLTPQLRQFLQSESWLNPEASNLPMRRNVLNYINRKQQRVANPTSERDR